MTDTWTCGDCGDVFIPDDEDIENANHWQAVMCKPCEAKYTEGFRQVMTRPGGLID